jgi:hypothetical protein
MGPSTLGDDLPGRLLALWEQGLRPDLADFLAGADGPSPATLLAVLRIDQRQRWLAGERVAAEAYLEAYPALRDQVEPAVELVYCEFLLREELGERPALAEYHARFPAYRRRLEEQIEVHAAMSGLSASPGESLNDLHTRPTVPPGAADAPTPLHLPGYEILRELGRGGMGVVYEVRSLRTGRRQALKVVQRADAALLYRFKKEFRSLVGLTHPNLVTLYELSGEGPAWYFTMELIDGVRFLSHVYGPGQGRPAGGLTPAMLTRLRGALAGLVEGVHFLHASGRLHRDIKPSNVMVTPEGRVVLLDFGLAAEMDRTGTYLSLHPRLLGTLAYMAPEQAACQPVSPASDWYAVGVLLFEVLTGRHPFTGSPIEMLLNKQERDAPPPGQFAPGLPDDLAELCEKLLRRDPAARPPGAEIRRLLGGPAPETVRRRASSFAPVQNEVPLVGRDGPLAQLAAAFDRVRQGRTVVVSMPGRSGAGKTALVRRFLDGLAEGDGAVVLSGRCYEQEAVPYKALDSLVDALSRYLESLPGPAAAALLPRDAAALARLFPVLRQVEAVASAPPRVADASDPAEVRRRALAALRELLARLGDRRPLVLAIDDLQWGDADSAAILADLLQPPDPPVLLLVAAFRSEDADNPCLRAFARIAGEGHLECVRVPVEPLGEDERRELACRLLGGGGGPDQAERVARQSGGFPFFLHELARFVRDMGGAPGCGSSPAENADRGRLTDAVTLGGVLWARVRRLPPQARRLLEVVAVAGRPVDAADALLAAGVDAEALVRLRNERLVRTTAARHAGPGGARREQVETYHDRIRETMVLRLAQLVRMEHHRRLAEVLAANDTAEPEWKAVHFLGAGQPDRAAPFFALAARRAAEALAFDRAARMYRQARDLHPHDPDEKRRLSAALGDCLARAGRGADAAREYLVAADGAAPPDAP